MKNSEYYDGNTLKFGVTLRGQKYLVKFKKPKNKYDTSVYSEYIASNFIKKLGYSCQETCIGFYNNEKCVICKDFTEDGETLHSFSDLGESSLDTSNLNKSYTYSDVVYVLNHDTKLSTEEREKVLTQFWIMYIFDAILGNRDRHGGNWGVIKRENKHYVSPIYDNGASLFPQVVEPLMDLNILKFNDNTVRTFFYDRTILRGIIEQTIMICLTAQKFFQRSLMNLEFYEKKSKI
jgi:hypothetical protein